MHAVGGYELIEPYKSIVNGNYDGIDKNKVDLVKGLNQDSRPDSEYSASKVFGESLGKYFAEFENMEGLAIRIGTVHPDNKPGADPRSWVSYFSQNDIFLPKKENWFLDLEEEKMDLFNLTVFP